MKGVRVKQATLGDIPAILAIEEIAWPEGMRASEEIIASRISTFPEGNLVAVANSDIQGVISTQIINYDLGNDALSWDEVTDSGFIKSSHNPHGDTLYGVNLSVSPYSPRGVAKILLQVIGKMAIRLNLKRGILGGRIPRYHKFTDRMSPEEYLNGTTGTGRPLDPEIAFYKKIGLRVVKVIPNYIKDPESCNFGVLLAWDNPFYNRPGRWFWSWLFRVK